jgi:hypothetical protein
MRIDQRPSKCHMQVNKRIVSQMHSVLGTFAFVFMDNQSCVTAATNVFEFTKMGKKFGWLLLTESLSAAHVVRFITARSHLRITDIASAPSMPITIKFARLLAVILQQ